MAGNKKKRQYHRPPAQKVNIPRPVRLSQCMIAKNEEKNIERALSWAKGYAFEQIVVDTGSTDRTVEIAERMGAKVYNFEWINDFSAAKNYAISLCTGNWIAILDADEWIPESDMPKIMEVLQVCTNDKGFTRFDFIKTSLANLNDEGKIFHTMMQNRFFRNHRGIYYTGTIHEELNIKSEKPEVLEAGEITILHTGYQQSVYDGTDKLNRNIDMIRLQLESDPENVEKKAYLADSLFEKGTDDSKKEALALYREATDSDQILPDMLCRNAFMKVISYMIVDENFVDAEKYTLRALERLPDYIDFYALLSEIQFKNGRFAEAWDSIRTCEALFEKHGATQPNAILDNPNSLFKALCSCAVKLEDTENAVKYATLALKEEKMQEGMLGPLLMTLRRFGNASDQEMLEFLEKLYDFKNMRDKVFLARVANSLELLTLRDMIMARISPEEVAFMQSAEG